MGIYAGVIPPMRGYTPIYGRIPTYGNKKQYVCVYIYMYIYIYIHIIQGVWPYVGIRPYGGLPPCAGIPPWGYIHMLLGVCPHILGIPHSLPPFKSLSICQGVSLICTDWFELALSQCMCIPSLHSSGLTPVPPKSQAHQSCRFHTCAA